jgi:hypothetical protein
MHRTVVAILAVVLGTGCRDYAGPSAPHSVYALARVGSAHLPIPLNAGSPLPLLVADTFRLVEGRPRTEDPVLQQVTVIQQSSNGPPTRSAAEYYYEVDNGVLRYTNCPIGAFCAAADLVYSPRSFGIVGDSLFEILPPGSGLPQHVYGMVRR